MAPTKYIFVTGGVVSGLGKGIISSSIGKLLQARGYKVTIQKLDPYLNIDPGTLNPYEHGECYVTIDGAETDLDFKTRGADCPCGEICGIARRIQVDFGIIYPRWCSTRVQSPR